MIPTGLKRRDLLVVAVCIAGAAVLTALGANEDPRHNGWLLTMATVAAVAAGLTRTRPIIGLSVGTVAVVADVAIGPSLATVLIFSQILHDATAYGPRRLPTMLLWIGGMLTIGISIASLWWYRTAGAAVTGVLVALVLLLPVWTGMSIREHRDRSEAERRNARQVARLAEMDNRQAVAAERTRMARELHDVVANHLGIIAIHSTGARSRGAERQAEMRQALGVMRMNDTSEPVGALGIDDVPDLVRQAEQAGLTVRSHTLGTARPLPVAVDMAAYRIAQESLTNAVKHGGGDAQMTIDYQPELLAMTVTNTVRATADEHAETYGAKAGLIGMRERASLLGGTFSAGMADGGFRVQVTLPVEETSQ